MGGTAYFREAIPRLLLFVFLSFGAYDSQPYKVITRPSIYDILFCFMQNALPRGNLFGQCVSAFIYSAFSAMTSGATEVAHLNKHKVAP